MAPLIVNVPSLVIEVPGETPKSPETVVVPVLVTAEDPRTEKLAAAPRLGAVAADTFAKRGAKTSKLKPIIETIKNLDL